MQSTGCPKLDADLAAFRDLVNIAPDSAEQLEAALLKATAFSAGADLSAYDADAIRAHAEPALDDMLQLRIALGNRVGDWLARGWMSRPVQVALRGVFRDSRYATDMLGELIHKARRPMLPKRALKGFSGGQLNTLVNPKFGPNGTVDVRSGDVLLVRGKLANSAAIARIGDIDSQFSHIGLVYVPERGKPMLVEALIESGAVITPLDEALEHELARAVLFRPKDARLGAAAAALAKAHVDRSHAGPLKHIPYDFTMEPGGGYATMFCSKVIRLAYASATDGGLILPTFKTRLDLKNRHFFEQIGVTAEQTFAPADVELEPVFEVVAEWRDYRFTSLVRIQDAVMDKIFEWMDAHGYQFRETVWIGVISRLGRLSSYLPSGVKKLLSGILPNVPRNMTRETIAAIAMLHATAKPLTRELMRMERSELRKHGRPLHPRAFYQRLEEIRRSRDGNIGYLREASRR